MNNHKIFYKARENVIKLFDYCTAIVSKILNFNWLNMKQYMEKDSKD